MTNRNDCGCDQSRPIDIDAISTPNNVRTSNSDSSRNSAFNTFLEKMQSVCFRTFQVCVILWLGAKGFASIRLLGRFHRRGRRSHGGADFLAKLPDSQVDVAIQIRHWRTPVQRRAIDELWGFMLRNGVPLGLIVTNSDFMRSAEEAAQQFTGRPIQLVSCQQLCYSMADLKLGLQKVGNSWSIDESFFRLADQLYFAAAMNRPSARGRRPKSLAAMLRLPDLAGEACSPESNPRTSKLWFFFLVVLLTLGLLLWLRLRGYL